jgi:hypothetical protein
MPNIKISELDQASAVGSSVVPVSDASGTITNKVTLQDIADLAPLNIPTGSIDLHNGGVQNAQILQFDDTSLQSVITGPTPDNDTNAQRLILQGQKGQGNGEGGDVYVWGGDADTNGGDIKIYAGDADNVSSGQGGYVNIDGGNGYNQGGSVSISAGNSNEQAGDITITAGYSSGTNGIVYIRTDNGINQWSFNSDGSLDCPNGATIGYLGEGFPGFFNTVNSPISISYFDIDNQSELSTIVLGPSISDSGGDARIVVASSDTGYHYWDFKSDGSTNLPGGLIFPNNTTIAQGTFDNGTGGNSGISLNCYVGYELNWQGGHLKSTIDNGATSANILCDSAIELPGTGIDNMEINSTGLIFPDGTTQNSANITSANITDFDSAVSGLLPVKDIVSGTGISVSSVSGVFTIDSSLTSVSEASKLATTVFNKTGSVIPKMSVVYINGGQGDLPTVTLAIASGEATSSKTYGITAEAISDMSSGKVIVEGALTGLNTDQFNPTAPTGNVNGTVVYLSPTVSGAITTTKPSAPNHLVAVGTIVRTHQNEGIIEVRIQNGFEIQELHNVKINGVAHQDVLVYNSGNSLWENNSNVVFSNTSGITGSITINNIVAISQANYDGLGSYDPNTIYYIV